MVCHPGARIKVTPSAWLNMNVLAQAEVSRETYWGISSTGFAVFYLLAAITIAVFLYGVYRRFSRYTDGDDDPFARVNDLPARVLGAAKIALSNEKQFNRDLYGGLMHAFIFWGFLTLFIATSILAIDGYVYEHRAGQLLGGRLLSAYQSWSTRWGCCSSSALEWPCTAATGSETNDSGAATPRARTISSSGRCLASASADFSSKDCGSTRRACQNTKSSVSSATASACSLVPSAPARR